MKRYRSLRTKGFHLLGLWGACLFLEGCISVKAYQRMYLNDEDMKLNVRPIEVPEINAQSYREGASGGDVGKTGGGCGCN
ncbi:MAG: DUF4266 domain-containing protein [Bacteroidia bacterium]|nr:DUF4266 domain-containing protein [Bacteroidia bacterium]